ncbi:unnamed protein product [Somion occarium]|uniref:SWR1-complex protein 5 n=1 Tax=Somion occarium TaxID=3059160 RepID=A0ABP1DPP6_9APHY
MQPETRKEDSDSEDDSDYVPPAGDESSSDEEPEAKRIRTGSPLPTVEDAAEQKRIRDALWAEFQASVSTPPVHPLQETKMVKVVKRFRFAGEDVVEMKEVPEDSDDARKWPLWRPDSDGNSKSVSPTPEGMASQASASQTGKPSSSGANTPIPSSQAGPSESKPKPTKRPGPRKPKVQLAPLPGKAKKLTTLDKSAMDWRSHVQAGQETGLKDELEAHRRGGGYLEKVEFLKRVEERKEEALEASKSGKRRR